MLITMTWAFGGLWFRSLSLFLFIFVFLFLPRSWLVLLSFTSSLTFFLLLFSNSLSFLPIVVTTFLWFLFDSVLRVFNVHKCEKFLLETFWERLDMHVVTITSSFTSSFNMLFTFCIQKISDRREFRFDFLAIKKSPIGIFLGIFRILLFAIFHINIPHNMISEVIHNNHIFDLSVFHHLFKNFLVEILTLGHCFIGILPAHIVAVDQRSFYCIVFIHVLETDSLAYGRFIVNSLATIPVPASAHFVEKWTVDFVHLCTVDLGKPISHLIFYNRSK